MSQKFRKTNSKIKKMKSFLFYILFLTFSHSCFLSLNVFSKVYKIKAKYKKTHSKSHSFSFMKYMKLKKKI